VGPVGISQQFPFKVKKISGYCYTQMPTRSSTRSNTQKNRNADESDNESLYNDSILGTDVSDIDEDETEHDVHYGIQSLQLGPLRDLNKFLNDPKMINPSGDPSTNIVDMQRKKPYKIPEPRITKFFQLLEQCRRARLPTMIYERQQDYAGIMLDFDIYQNNEEDQLTNELFGILVQEVIKLLQKLIVFPNKKETIYCAITRRPKITYSDDKQAFKDGFHLIFPGIKVSKGLKVLLIKKLISNEIIDQVFGDVEPANFKSKNKPYQREEFMDQMSSRVPVFFVGSATKKGSRAYKLTHVYKTTVNTETGNIFREQDSTFLTDKSINICHEFSLNWEKSNGIIKKVNYEVQPQYASEVEKEHEKITLDEERAAKNFGELSTSSILDAQVKEIKQLLDTLNPRRAEDYKEWRNVLCALANTSKSYKNLAEYFSSKSSKFNMSDFDAAWRGAVSGSKTGNKPLTVASIHYWAKIDNPNRYEELRKGGVYQILYKMVYIGYKEGKLNHSDMARLLFALLQHKYVTDTPEGQKVKVWYEFILDDDQHKDGELYKWRCWGGSLPTSISLYISETLPKLFEKVFENVKQNYDRATEPKLSKYYNKVLQNFKVTMNKLGDRGFKKNVILEAEDKFAKIGFANSLDTEPLIRGVCNGVLKLSLAPGGGPQLIQGYHSHLISKFTEVPYIAFDPYDPLTKKILITLRNLFPDNEPDSFDFTMKYLSSTIDGNPKESMFMLMTGSGSNGKSFLVELHKGAIGSIYGVKMPIEYLTSRGKSADNATPAVMMLKDASLAYYSESTKHDILNAARIKEVTGQETLAGRKLHQDIINFKPKCHHLCTTNYDFDIQCNDHGTWRRICKNPLKITFVDPTTDKYDPKDPLQRVADHAVTQQWTSDPEVTGRYLGYMVWEHYWLYRKHRGKVKAVPHPHIRFETEKYRNSQNVIEKFISQKLVRCGVVKEDIKTVGVDKTTDSDSPDNDKDSVIEKKEDVDRIVNEVTMSSQVSIYMQWYAHNNGDKIPAKGIPDMFKNSSIGAYIQYKSRGWVMIGHRFLKENEQPADDEEYAQKQVFTLEAPPDNFGIANETSEQFYERVCKEYDVVKNVFDGTAKYDIASDAIVDNQTRGGGSLYEQKYNNGDISMDEIPQPEERTDNIEFRGRLLPSGIVFKALEEPSINLLTDSYTGDMSGFLPVGDEMEVNDMEVVEIDELP
jgi:hypothetical protein